MHDGMPYGRIHCSYAVWLVTLTWSRSRALESLNSFHFQNLSPPPFTMGAGMVWYGILEFNVPLDTV